MITIRQFVESLDEAELKEAKSMIDLRLGTGHTGLTDEEKKAGKLDAVRMIRNRMNVGLKEAVWFYDKYINQ